MQTPHLLGVELITITSGTKNQVHGSLRQALLPAAESALLSHEPRVSVFVPNPGSTLGRIVRGENIGLVHTPKGFIMVLSIIYLVCKLCIRLDWFVSRTFVYLNPLDAGLRRMPRLIPT